jgi:transposase
VHLQVIEVHSDKKTYRYARLVQSYRREDGMPAQRVVASLGRLEGPEISALRLALKAAREGKTVVVAEEVAAKVTALSVRCSLTYLDVAVVRALWNELGLSAPLQHALPRDHDDVSAADVIFALVAQRCVAPGSKFSAQRWFPTTALPELLRISPEQFNNSRLHRDLEALDQATQGLQESLATLQHARTEGANTWFLDVTDAFFEGRGCDLAERGRTKEGLRNRFKIGVVLLCNERGIPMRWQVVPGKRADHACMGAMVEGIQDCLWVGKAPVVCDRAMGQASSVARLLRSGLRFLTAVPRTEIESHDVDLDIPHRFFSDYEPTCELAPSDEAVTDVAAAQEQYAKDAAQIGHMAEHAGMKKVSDTLYVLDLGNGVRPVGEEEARWVGPDDIDPETLVGGASMLAWARIFQRVLDSADVKNRAELARMTNISRARVTEIMNMLKLDRTVQDEILVGTYGQVSEHELREVIKLEGAEAQRQALQAYSQEQAIHPSAHPMRPRKLRITQTRPVRRVVYFNPEVFVTQRLNERKRQRKLDAFLAELNTKLRSPHSHRDEHAVRFAVMQWLSRDNALRLFDIAVEQHRHEGTDKLYYQVSLSRDQAEWQRRRRYHGFVLLVAHPEIPLSAAELAKLYRAKDVIERDFRLIKDVVELRPIYHHTDAKVRAHVTLCVLALLLQRVLEGRLAAAGRPMTAAACLETLATCRLNRYEPNELLDFDYSVTQPSPEQLAILQALGLTSLIRHQELATRLTPRQLPA